MNTKIATFVVGLALGTSATAAAAWNRTYGYGSASAISQMQEISFIDDSAMPLSSVKQVIITIDNEDVAGSYARAKVCNRPKSGSSTPAFTCQSFTPSPISTLGLSQFWITDSASLATLASTAVNVPYIVLSSSAGSHPDKIYLTSITMLGN